MNSKQLAAAPKEELVQAGEYPPLPEWSKMDNLGGLVPSEIRQELRAYVDSDRALRAQAAPAVAAADVLEQIANEPPINGNNLAAARVMMAAQMLRDQITEAAAAPQPAVQQGDELPREDFAWLVVQEACETEPADEDDPECIRILRRDLKSAVLSAFLRHDAAHPAAPVAQGDAEDAARLDFMIEHRAYVVSDPDACPGYWLHFVHKETGRTWVQGDEHPTPRAAIDAARSQAKEGA